MPDQILAQQAPLLINAGTEIEKGCFAKKQFIRGLTTLGYLTATHSIYLLPISEGFTRMADMVVSLHKDGEQNIPFIIFMSTLSFTVSASIFSASMREKIQEIKSLLQGKEPENWTSFSSTKEAGIMVGVVLAGLLAAFIAAIETRFFNQDAAADYDTFSFLTLTSVNHLLIVLTALNALFNEGWEVRKLIGDLFSSTESKWRLTSTIAGLIFTVFTLFEEAIDGLVPLKETFNSSLLVLSLLVAISAIKGLMAACLMGRITIESIEQFTNSIANKDYNNKSAFSFTIALGLAGVLSFYLRPLSQAFYEKAFETESLAFVFLSWMMFASSTALATSAFYPYTAWMTNHTVNTWEGTKPVIRSSYARLSQHFQSAIEPKTDEKPLTTVKHVTYDTITPINSDKFVARQSFFPESTGQSPLVSIRVERAKTFT